jgi:transcriptional regulator with XRE-family HTH domain
MSELIEKLRAEFQDKEYREAYAEECLNAMIASQIKALREQREMTQKQLADATGMGQPRIPLLEDASYENWSVNTLKRLARAFDVTLSVKFETFSRLIQDFENMNRESLRRPTFAQDAPFQRRSRYTTRRTRHRPSMRHKRNVIRFPVRKNAIAAGIRKGPGRALRAFGNAPNLGIANQLEAMGESR